MSKEKEFEIRSQAIHCATWNDTQGALKSINLLNDEAIDEEDEEGRTLLMAIVRWDPFVAKALLERGADVNHKSANGVTPLMSAAVANNVESLEILMNYGASIDAGDSNGMTALMKAILFSNDAAIEFLLEAGADINVKDTHGQTSSDYAERFDRSPQLKERLRQDHA